MSPEGREDSRRLPVRSRLGGYAGLLMMLAVCFFGSSFLLKAIISFMGVPEQLPLPWCGLDDFAATADGTVYADLGTLRRIVRYDRDGQFVRSYPYPEKDAGRVAFAVSDKDELFLLMMHAVYKCTRDMEVIVRFPPTDKTDDIWTLMEDGSAKHTPKRRDARADWAVRPGEILFSPNTHFGENYWKRYVFMFPDNTVLVRKGNRLFRMTRNKEVLQSYGTSPLNRFLLSVGAFLFTALVGVAFLPLIMTKGTKPPSAEEFLGHSKPDKPES